MAISYSEAQTYLECQKKHKLQYIDKIRVDNVHFKFGTMAHKVLETRKIPEEILYNELKEHFNITSWENYFNDIFEELDVFLLDYDILETEWRFEDEFIKGIVDLIIKHKETGKIVIIDYKFTTSSKDTIDLTIDQQQTIYATAYAKHTGTPLTEINVGYVSIPKMQLDTPTVLKSGKLSVNKQQKVKPNTFRAKIVELGLDESDYSEFLLNIENNTFLEIVITSLDITKVELVFNNLLNIVNDMKKGYILEKWDAYDCGRCEMRDYCKLRGKE